LRSAAASTRTLREEVGRKETQIGTLERVRWQTEALPDPDATIPDSHYDDDGGEA
jgi:hypothetical protein